MPFAQVCVIHTIAQKSKRVLTYSLPASRAVIGEEVASQTVLGGCVIGTQMGEGRAYLSEVC